MNRHVVLRSVVLMGQHAAISNASSQNPSDGWVFEFVTFPLARGKYDGGVKRKTPHKHGAETIQWMTWRSAGMRNDSFMATFEA